MASLNISQEELKAVEQTRQRLFQLSNSIGSLKTDVYNSSPLPNLYAFFSSFEGTSRVLVYANSSSALQGITTSLGRYSPAKHALSPLGHVEQ
jgi:hypothetical protein